MNEAKVMLPVPATGSPRGWRQVTWTHLDAEAVRWRGTVVLWLKGRLRPCNRTWFREVPFAGHWQKKPEELRAFVFPLPAAELGWAQLPCWPSTYLLRPECLSMMEDSGESQVPFGEEYTGTFVPKWVTFPHVSWIFSIMHLISGSQGGGLADWRTKPSWTLFAPDKRIKRKLTFHLFSSQGHQKQHETFATSNMAVLHRGRLSEFISK